MGSDPQAGNELGRILRLADGCDPTALLLTAEEGFLLSRIDGHTPWRLLRQIAGLDEDEADLVLEGWLATGTAEVVGYAAPPKQDRGAARARDVARENRFKNVGDEAIDESLELSVEVQRRILDFEKRLELTDHEIIGVEVGADAKQIKTAYYKLSKEFHPDRYFRRKTGEYTERLDRIFKRVLDAYELLMTLEIAPPEEATADASPTRPQTPECMSKLDRLKQRMPFKMSDSVPEERQQQAQAIFQGAITSERLGRIGESLKNVKIALSFDPYNRTYKAKLRELELRHADLQVEEMLGDLTGLRDMTEERLEEAAEHLDCILAQRPLDIRITSKAAEVALERERLDEAMEYVQTAVEQEPDVASHHTTLGLVHRARKEIGHAKKAFERALELDSGDARAKKAMAAMRVGRAVA